MRLLLIALTFIALNSASSLALEIENKWVRLQVGDIEVLTEADEGKAIEIAEQVSMLKRSLRAYTMVEPAAERALRLYVFEDQWSLRPYALLPNGAAAGFTTTDDVTVMMAVSATYNVNTRRGQLYNVLDPFEVMAHEYVHAYVAERAPRTPLWLNEGLADFFSTYRADDDYVYIGEPIQRHQDLLAKPGRNIPTARLILLDQSREDYHGGAITSLTYAQCWATTHFLMTDKTRRQAMMAYLQSLHEGSPMLLAFEQDLEPYFPEQNVELREYTAQKQMPHFRLKRKEDVSDSDVRRTELDEATTLLRLGELAGGTSDQGREFATEHFKASLALNPALSGAWTGLAWIRLYLGEWWRARELLTEALEHDPGDPRIRGLLGYAMVMEHLPDTEEGELPPQVVEARNHLEAAMGSEKPSPWYYYSYAASYRGTPDNEPGIKAAQTAIALAPWTTSYYELLIDLYRDAGQLEVARAVLQDELFGRTEPVERFETEMALVGAEVDAATQVWNAGRTEEASMMLIETLTPSEFAPLRQYVRTIMAELGIDIVYQRYVEILEMDNQGDHGEAILRLDAFVDDIDHPELEAMAAKFRPEIVARAESDA